MQRMKNCFKKVQIKSYTNYEMELDEFSYIMILATTMRICIVFIRRQLNHYRIIQEYDNN